MATTHLSYAKRDEIMRNVGKLIPHTSSHDLTKIYDTEFKKIEPQFLKLALPQIIRNKELLNSNATLEGYERHELFKAFEEIYFAIPKIYTPSTAAQHHENSTWGDSHACNNNECNFICVDLQKPAHLPICHTFHRYGNDKTTKYNKIHLEGELLDLNTNFIKNALPIAEAALKHNKMYLDLQKFLQKFTTTKQLTDTWPEIETFIPPEYLSKAIKQKKAKKVALNLSEKNRINEINKELFIQKMMKGM